MIVKLNRGQICRQPAGTLVIDTTVKSGHVLALPFAPTWPMVWGYKKGRLSELDYINQYEQIYRRAIGRNAHQDLHYYATQFAVLQGKNEPTLTLLCYCRDGNFCHTHLMIEWLVRDFPDMFEDARTSIPNTMIRSTWTP